jgi:hypothetical protein
VIDDDGGGVCCVFVGTFWAYITTAVLAKTTKRNTLRTESIATTEIL